VVFLYLLQYRAIKRCTVLTQHIQFICPQLRRCPYVRKKLAGRRRTERPSRSVFFSSRCPPIKIGGCGAPPVRTAAEFSEVPGEPGKCLGLHRGFLLVPGPHLVRESASGLFPRRSKAFPFKGGERVLPRPMCSLFVPRQRQHQSIARPCEEDIQWSVGRFLTKEGRGGDR